ncbi:MAG: 16S rRNA processing protein RimM [Deltaproteobacteria bacterium]|nr:16S rRNA processing protein RimM [Deltaproteobacteria bacterium]MBM4316150.1 16S rRNA processing protein RimM [Deltaproteobacteria bacterium]
MELVEIAKVVRPHGFKGALVAKTDSGRDSALSYLTTLYLGKSPDITTEHQVIESAWMPKGWKLELSGITSDTMAKGYRTYSVYALRQDLAPVAENEFYIHDLLGSSVVDSFSQKHCGTLTSIEPTSNQTPEINQDRWWIESNGNVFSIPATSKYIQKIDISQRTIWLKNLSDFLSFE